MGDALAFEVMIWAPIATRHGGKGRWFLVGLHPTVIDAALQFSDLVEEFPSPAVVVTLVESVLNPETGGLLKQGRLTGALGPHFSSPVAADGHVYFTSEAGAVAVVNPGTDLTPIAINDLGEDTYATPAFADGRIYIRTVAALYAFGLN